MEEIKNVETFPVYFEEQLKYITEAGFKPIGVSQMMLEDTFIFQHNDEAHKAYEEMEQRWWGKPYDPNTPPPDGECVQGWWYGKGAFITAAEDYEEENSTEIVVYWFNEKFIRNSYK